MLDGTLTSERLREALRYDPATGVFTRKIRTARRVRVGDVAGSIHCAGYIHIALDGRRYKAHRLAWLYMHGVWPDGQIDHIDGDRGNNRISNLRDVSRSVNGQNQRTAHRSNPNKLLGVTMVKRGNLARPYMAQIVVRGKHINLGMHDTPERAHAAYLSAKREMHEGCTI